MSLADSRRNRLVWLAVIVVLIFHHDFWWWHDTTLVLGLPIGLLFHFSYCLLASMLMYALIKLVGHADMHVDMSKSADS